MLIREATKKDIPALCDIYRILFAEMASLQPDIWKEGEQNTSFLKELIRDSNAVLYIAEVEDQIAGFTLATENKRPPFPCIQPHRYAYLMDMAVLPPFRGKGIGSYLIERVKDWARSRQLDFVELGVLQNNTGAIRLYERQGFETQQYTMRCMLK